MGMLGTAVCNFPGPRHQRSGIQGKEYSGGRGGWGGDVCVPWDPTLRLFSVGETGREHIKESWPGRGAVEPGTGRGRKYVAGLVGPRTIRFRAGSSRETCQVGAGTPHGEPKLRESSSPGRQKTWGGPPMKAKRIYVSTGERSCGWRRENNFGGRPPHIRQPQQHRAFVAPHRTPPGKNGAPRTMGFRHQAHRTRKGGRDRPPPLTGLGGGTFLPGAWGDTKQRAVCYAIDGPRKKSFTRRAKNGIGGSGKRHPSTKRFFWNRRGHSVSLGMVNWGSVSNSRKQNTFKETLPGQSGGTRVRRDGHPNIYPWTKTNTSSSNK